jgi:threonine dehydratase
MNDIRFENLLDRIRDADVGIRPAVLQTPLDHSASLSRELGCELLLKADHLQPTGAFKIRGATNKIRTLGEAARRTGVITASTGNHGLGVSRAGKLAGVAVTVYIGHGCPQAKLDAIASFGAEIVRVDGPALAAELEARRQSELQAKPYVAPYNDLDTIAGQGTIGLELLRQTEDLDAVFICVGGGGLISGVGSVLKCLSPRTKVVGVWPEASTHMLKSLEAGHLVEMEEGPTLSEASTGAIEPGSVTFPLCRQVIDETIVVSEAEIASAMRAIARAEHWMVEGTAAVALAGLAQRAADYRGKKVAVLLCGRNIALQTFLDAMEMAEGQGRNPDERQDFPSSACT